MRKNNICKSPEERFCSFRDTFDPGYRANEKGGERKGVPRKDFLSNLENEISNLFVFMRLNGIN